MIATDAASATRVAILRSRASGRSIPDDLARELVAIAMEIGVERARALLTALPTRREAEMLIRQDRADEAAPDQTLARHVLGIQQQYGSTVAATFLIAVCDERPSA